MRNDNYDDIINMKHHVSKKHCRMAMKDRAAQFAPFADLTGYKDAIDEMARKVESSFNPELDNDK